MVAWQGIDSSHRAAQQQLEDFRTPCYPGPEALFTTEQEREASVNPMSWLHVGC